MKTIDLEKQKVGLDQVICLAGSEPLLLVTADGREFIVSPADDFDREAAALRQSHRFQQFLDQRSHGKGSVPLESIEAEIEAELKAQPPS